ncbi:26211_t:CDS:2, partial [Gigaspora margarita]
MKKRAEVARSAPRNYYFFVDLKSSEKYIDLDGSSGQSSDNFMELVNPDKIINRLAVSSFEKKRPATYTRNSKCIQQRRNKILKEAAVGNSKILHFFSSVQPLAIDSNKSDEDLQSQEHQSEKKKELNEEERIHKAIEFVNGVMSEEILSKAEEARYIAVLYFFQLYLKSQMKIEAAKTVTEVVN